jgi:hypothetical protein
MNQILPTFHFKSRLFDVRSLRNAILKMADEIQRRKTSHAYLVLVDPKVTTSRLKEEWKKHDQFLKPEVMRRITIVVVKDGEYWGIPEEPPPEIRPRLEEFLRGREKTSGTYLPRRKDYYELLKILLHKWFLEEGPTTAKELARIAGCTYPTVARATRNLAGYLQRDSRRRIELSRFPKDEWFRLLAEANRSRSTMNFVDRSGQPRSPESLMRRLLKTGIQTVGVGGVFGAKHHYPDLNLVGSPRLDLSVHCPGDWVDLGFVEHLDPALRLEENSGEPTSLVIHFIRRKESLFIKAQDDQVWADPVECLLDLSEARMESQALEFLQHYIRQRQATL